MRQAPFWSVAASIAQTHRASAADGTPLVDLDAGGSDGLIPVPAAGQPVVLAQDNGVEGMGAIALGAVMDELSMLLLTIPIFFPMVIGLDFGMPKESVAIWFGIMVLMTVGFGLLAPRVSQDDRWHGRRHAGDECRLWPLL